MKFDGVTKSVLFLVICITIGMFGPQWGLFTTESYFYKNSFFLPVFIILLIHYEKWKNKSAIIAIPAILLLILSAVAIGLFQSSVILGLYWVYKKYGQKVNKIKNDDLHGII